MNAKRQEKAADIGSAKLTTAEVAARYRVAPSTIRYWHMTGYIPGGVHYGRKVLYDEAVLDAWDEQKRRDEEAAARGGDAA